MTVNGDPAALLRWTAALSQNAASRPGPRRGRRRERSRGGGRLMSRGPGGTEIAADGGVITKAHGAADDIVPGALLFVCRRHFLAVGNWLRANTRGHFSAFPSVLGRPSLARSLASRSRESLRGLLRQCHGRPSDHLGIGALRVSRKRGGEINKVLKLYKTCKVSVSIFTYTTYTYA